MAAFSSIPEINTDEFYSYKAVAYYRLSKDDGKNRIESDSITNQRKLIHHYLQVHSEILLVGEEYDDGYTGTNYARPGFQRVLEQVRNKKANCVIVKDLSRLGREYIETGEYLERVFPSLGVRFIAINDDVDSDHQRSGDELVIPIKNIMNESYCREVSQKLRKQFRVQRSNGEFLGPFACYGYLKAPADKHRLVIDDYAAEIVRGIFSLKMKGYSQQAIANALNAEGVLSPSEYKKSKGFRYKSGLKSAAVSQWSAVAIHAILTNPIYIGTLVQGKRGTPNYKVKEMRLRDPSQWIVVEHNHPPIVDELLFSLVQQMLKRDTRTSPTEKAVLPLSGLLFCADCGRAMCRRSVTRNGRKFNYYVCSGFKHEKCCSSHSIEQGKLEQAVLRAIEIQMQTIAELNELLSEVNQGHLLQAKIDRLDKMIAQKNAEIDACNAFKLHLYESLSDQIITRDEYNQMRSKYHEKERIARIAIAKLEGEKSRVTAGTALDDSWIHQLIQYRGLQHLTREAAVSLVDHIEVFKDKRIHIIFNYRNEMEDYQALLSQSRVEVQ